MIIDGIRYAQKCDECKQGMNEGYVIEGGAEYYCSDPCLHKHITPKEFLELYIGDDEEGEGGGTQTYYTEWDDVDDWPSEWHEKEIEI